MAFGGPPRPPKIEGQGCFVAWFAFCAVLGLGFLGLIAWAVISLVSHVTG